MKNPKISMFVEGHGYGHAARMYWLAKELNAEILTFGDAVNFFKEKNFPFVEIEKPYSLVFNDEEFDLTKSFAEMLKLFDMHTVKKVVDFFKDTDIAIVDSSLLGFIVAKFLRKKVIFISNSTDVSVFFKGRKATLIGNSVNSLLSKADKVLVCDFPPPYTISYGNVSQELENIEFIGPLVNVDDIKRGKREHYVISFGSSYSTDILDILDSLNYKFVSSKFEGKNIKKVKNARSYLGRAKVVIGHGGHSTIMESLLLGVPLVLIPEKSYAERYNNSKGVEKNLLGVVLDEDFISPLVVEKALEDALLLQENVKRFSRWARKFNAIERVKETVNELLP